MKKRHGMVILSFIVLYILLTFPWIFWPVQDMAIGIIMFGLYSLLAVGLACDTIEVMLALGWPKQIPAHITGKPSQEKAAILMTICNDSKTEYLKSLKSLGEAGYSVYILDDSTQPITIPKALINQVTHVRRGTRQGAKAGNLNYWLKKYGDRYEYSILLDADSVISKKAADMLLMTAEHPENANAAIFQAKIEPIKDKGSLLKKILGAGARPRNRVIQRVHAPLGLLLSFGHNQLLRLAPIRTLGGFDETLTCEDTVLSLNLAAAGWRAVLVDVWTHDTDPETVSTYVRRTLRWARQTVELFGRPWYDVPLKLKLLLCRHLLGYLLPIIGALLLGISVWTGPARPEYAWRFLVRSLSFASGYGQYGLTLWPAIIVFVLFMILRIVVARKEGISWRLLLLSTIFGSAPYALLILPLAYSMLSSALGYKVRFIPTNSSHALHLDKTFGRRLIRGGAAAIFLAVLLLGAFRQPGSLLVGFNLIWIGYLVISPMSLLTLSIIDRRTVPNAQSGKGTIK